MFSTRPHRSLKPVPGTTLSPQNCEEHIIPLIKSLPNLRTFHHKCKYSPLARDSSLDLLGALKSSSRVRNLTLYLPPNIIPHLSGLDLSSLVALSIANTCELAECKAPDPSSPAGLSLPSLKSLNVSCIDGAFAKRLSLSKAPNLQQLTFEFNLSKEFDVKAILLLLRSFGAGLRSLNLSCEYRLSDEVDMPSILRLCPNLTSLSFDACWKFPPETHSLCHEHLERVGIEGGFLAISKGFGRDFYFSVPWKYQGRFPQMKINAAANIAWLLSKRHMLRLRCIRALSPQLLRVYTDQGGQDAVDVDKLKGFMMLVKQCEEEDFRFEDCTGNLFASGERPKV